MKKFLALLLVLGCLALPAKSYMLSSIRSLSAVGAVTNGSSFGFASKTGGLQWSVLLSGSGTFTYQVQVKMTDGTWTPLSTVTVTSTISNFVTNFSGPFNDMRVAVTAWTSGTLTADIFCTN